MHAPPPRRPAIATLCHHRVQPFSVMSSGRSWSPVPVHAL